MRIYSLCLLQLPSCNNPLLDFQIQKNKEDKGMHDDISEQISTLALPKNGGAAANADAHL